MPGRPSGAATGPAGPGAFCGVVGSYGSREHRCGRPECPPSRLRMPPGADLRGGPLGRPATGPTQPRLMLHARRTRCTSHHITLNTGRSRGGPPSWQRYVLVTVLPARARAGTAVSRSTLALALWRDTCARPTEIDSRPPNQSRHLDSAMLIPAAPKSCVRESDGGGIWRTNSCRRLCILLLAKRRHLCSRFQSQTPRNFDRFCFQSSSLSLLLKLPLHLEETCFQVTTTHVEFPSLNYEKLHSHLSDDK